MKIIEKFKEFIKKVVCGLPGNKTGKVPLLIIKKESDQSDEDVKEYKSIQEAITDLENDPNVPMDKIEKLKASLKNLKNKTVIKIKNGKIIK